MDSEGFIEQLEYISSKSGKEFSVNNMGYIYLESKEDVLKFIRRLIYVNGVQWCGEEGVQKRLREEIQRIENYNMLDKVGVEFADFSVDGGAVRISKISINNFSDFEGSPLLNKKIS